MLNGKRILLVDDSLTIRKFLRNILLRASAEEVEEASNGREALALIESGKPCDLVLLDLMLPDIDGMQVLQEVRKINERCAIVMITGTGGVKAATMAVRQGADGYIGKQDLTLGNDPADFYFALDQAMERRAGLVAQKELQQFKSDFYSMITHDLRNPAGSIVLSTEMLLRDETGPLTSEQKEIVAIAHSSAEKLLSLINNYLDFAKIDAGFLRLNVSDVELRSLVESSARAARFHAAAKEQTITLDLPAKPVPAQADAEKFKQVLDNLISNAIKYTPRGGKITVSMEVDGEAEEATLKVIDNGPGIPPGQLPALFTKYHRVPGQLTRNVKGTGLGLVIVKEIITAHGGSVCADSEGEGKGTTFVVTLPLRQVAKVEARGGATL